MLERLPKPVGSRGRTPYVNAFLERSNMEVMRFVTPVISLVCILALLSTVMPIVIWEERSTEMLWCYRIVFAALAILNPVFGLLSSRYLHDASPKPGSGRRNVSLYIILSCSLNLWITIADYAKMGRYFFLLVALFVAFGLFFIAPSYSVPFMGIIYGVTLWGLNLSGLLSPIQVITLTCYLVAIIAVSFSNYRARVRAAVTNERVIAASRHDELTGSLNRRAFDEDMQTYTGQELYIVMSDVDELKFYNDIHGHPVGDRLIVAFAQSMTNAFGKSRVYRFGGDEFIAVFPGSDEEDLRERIRQWRDEFRSQTVAGGHVHPSCSAGCVHGMAETVESVRDLLRIADMLLYRSKDDGRDKVTYAEYSDGLLHEALVSNSASTVPEGSVDELTGLSGKFYFLDHASEVAPVLLHKGQSVSFVYFNVANLKDYNAKFGFAEGDKLLRAVAETLQDVFPHRMLSRFGDDRFVVMAAEEGLAEALERACALVHDLHRDRLYSLRAGVFRYTSEDVEVRYACDCARIACESLRGHYDVLYRYYTDELGETMRRRNLVLERFDDALARGYIQPYYQPIIRSVSDLVCEFEVLSRWVEPGVGMRSPAEFIPALEDAHLIHRLDLHIVEEVCKNYHRLTGRGFTACPCSINFSRLDFEACDVVDEVVSILDRYDVPHEMVRVEVTESALGVDSTRLKESLVRFRELGFEVWMDDFGSGYSALNVLREYDFDLVKFDMSFLRTTEDDPTGRAAGIMLTNLVSMVKELGLQTLIEGVETVEQLMFLQTISFEKVQGYVFGRPQSFEDLCVSLSKWELMTEEPEKRAYFDRVGMVNLVQPVEQGSAFDPTGTADGVPVAVLEHANGVLRHLEYSATYARFLEAEGEGGVLQFENTLNARASALAHGIWSVVGNLARTDEWVLVGSTASRDHTCYARCVARVPGGDTFAFLVCAVPTRGEERTQG